MTQEPCTNIDSFITACCLVTACPHRADPLLKLSFLSFQLPKVKLSVSFPEKASPDSTTLWRFWFLYLPVSVCVCVCVYVYITLALCFSYAIIIICLHVCLLTVISFRKENFILSFSFKEQQSDLKIQNSCENKLLYQTQYFFIYFI